MRTIYFKNEPKIEFTSSICGPKESNSHIRNFIDVKLKDDLYGEKTFEIAETKMMYTCIDNLLMKSKKKIEEIDAFIGGDLLNQIIVSSYTARNFNTAFLGVYNACATFCESIILGSTFIDGGYLNNVICSTSSHFSTAERQYRYPLELGCTRPPLSQWTVTGCGSILLSKKGNIKVTNATIGKVVDYGIKDANNMGAVMAPSACDTILTHLENTGTTPNDYDMILTGDLGSFGSKICKDLLWEKGVDVENVHDDCGKIIYNENQREYQGGSGAGCSSLVFSSYIYQKMINKEIKKVLLVTTGALLSTTSSQQGETIPSISHAVTLESV